MTSAPSLPVASRARPHPAEAQAMSNILAENYEGLASGSLEVRLATSAEDIAASQALRFAVFYEERAAVADATMAALRRDIDVFDAVADHLLVVDHARGPGPEGIVATYRLMRRAHAEKAGRFYTAGEYDISLLLDDPGEILELGRSCVHAEYRSKHVIDLLWRGIAAYVFRHDVKLMFGCASLPGTDVEALKLPLAYLHHNHLAPEGMRPRALPELYTGMDLIPADQIDRRRGFMSVPPLIKGYLRLGAFIGDGAVVDHQFNTTDVCIVVKPDLVSDRYYNHYARRSSDA
jgi:putative hemolysin